MNVPLSVTRRVIASMIVMTVLLVLQLPLAGASPSAYGTSDLAAPAVPDSSECAGCDVPVLEYSTLRIRYPESAKRAGIEGDVVLRVLVDESGKPLRCQLQQTTDSVFTQAAMQAVMGARFRPAVRKGRPVSLWVSVPVTFRLN